MKNFEQENCKLDERISEINSDTLAICNKILANRSRYSSWIVKDAIEVKQQLTSN